MRFVWSPQLKLLVVIKLLLSPAAYFKMKDVVQTIKIMIVVTSEWNQSQGPFLSAKRGFFRWFLVEFFHHFEFLVLINIMPLPVRTYHGDIHNHRT